MQIEALERENSKFGKCCAATHFQYIQKMKMLQQYKAQWFSSSSLADSEKSGKIYRNFRNPKTAHSDPRYRDWRKWCKMSGFNPLPING